MRRSSSYRDTLTVIRLVESPTTDPLGPVQSSDEDNWQLFATLRGNRVQQKSTVNPDSRNGLTSTVAQWKVRDGATPAAVNVLDQIIYDSRLWHIVSNDSTEDGRSERLITATEIYGATVPTISTDSGSVACFFGRFFGSRFFGRFFG